MMGDLDRFSSFNTGSVANKDDHNSAKSVSWRAGLELKGSCCRESHSDQVWEATQRVSGGQQPSLMPPIG